MNKILELLALESKDISSQFRKASLEGRGTPQEVSDRREDIFSDFLRRYFPFPFRVAKGNIIDSFGKESASIDAILLNPSHPYIVSNNSKYSAILADGVDLAIELKPELKSDIEISRALKQIISVKKLRKVESVQVPLICSTTNGELEKYKRIPCVIFADSTYSDIGILVEKVINFYIENNTPRILQFDLIVINDAYVIFNSSKANFININVDGIGYVKTDSYTLAFFLYNVNRFTRSSANLFRSKSVLEHYLTSNEIPGLPMFYDKELNTDFSDLPLFDLDFDHDEIHRSHL